MSAFQLCLPDVLMAVDEPGTDNFISTVNHFSYTFVGDFWRDARDDVASNEEVGFGRDDMIVLIVDEECATFEQDCGSHFSLNLETDPGGGN